LKRHDDNGIHVWVFVDVYEIISMVCKNDYWYFTVVDVFLRLHYGLSV